MRSNFKIISHFRLLFDILMRIFYYEEKDIFCSEHKDPFSAHNNKLYTLCKLIIEVSTAKLQITIANHSFAQLRIAFPRIIYFSFSPFSNPIVQK